MTSRTLLLLSFLAASIYTSAQDNYSGFNYQAVVRDAQGQPMPNQSVGVQFVLGCGIAAPYMETHSTTSDAQGLIALVIGEGTPGGAIPSFDAIDWNGCGATPWSLTIAMDITGGTNYVQVGVQELKAVPFALNTLNGGDPNWAVAGDDLINTNSGNVGIGNSTPNEKLDVEGTVKFAQPGSRSFYMPNWPPFEKKVIGGVYTGEGVNAPVTRYYSPDENWADVGVDTIGNFIVQNNDVTNLIIKGNGDIGIGTTEPEAKLHVNGDLKLTDGSEGLGKVLTSDADGLASWSTPTGGGAGWSLLGDDLSNTNSGNVGIGTTTPTSKFEVVSAASTFRILGGINAGPVIEVAEWIGAGPRNPYMMFRSESAPSNIWKLGMTIPGGFQMTTPTGAGLVLSPGGDVGIGTATPVSKLDVVGHVHIQDQVAPLPPTPNAALEVNSTSSAILLSRMNTAQRDAMESAPGMMIYNTEVGKFQGYVTTTTNVTGAQYNGPQGAFAAQIGSFPPALGAAGQSFKVATTGVLKSLTLVNFRLNNGTGPRLYHVKILEGDPTVGGSVLAELDIMLDGSTVGEMIFPQQPLLQAGSDYSFVIEPDASEYDGTFWETDPAGTIGFNDPSLYPDGSVYTAFYAPGGTPSYTLANADFRFQIVLTDGVDSWVDLH